MNLLVLASPSLDFLGSYIWMFATFIVLIVAGIGFLVYRYYIEPPLARQITAAKWSNGVPAFIENETGVVELSMSDKKLPEGVVHYKRKGWFLLPQRSISPLDDEPNEPVIRPYITKKMAAKMDVDKEYRASIEMQIKEWENSQPKAVAKSEEDKKACLLYTSPSPRD